MSKQCKINFHLLKVKMDSLDYRPIIIHKCSHKANMVLKLLLKVIEICQISIRVILVLMNQEYHSNL